MSTAHIITELFVSSRASIRRVELAPVPSAGGSLEDDALYLSGKAVTDMELTNQNSRGILCRT